MFNISILASILKDLEINFKNYLEFIYNLPKNPDEEMREEFITMTNKVSLRLNIFKSEINKLKVHNEKVNELNKLKAENEKYDEKIIQLNNLLFKAVNNLKRNTNIFKLTSSSTELQTTQFRPRHLINLTLRLNKSYSCQEGMDNFLPNGCLDPFPIEQFQIKSSFLNFNLEEGARLKMPIVHPDGSSVNVKKGSILEIKYPDLDPLVFFRYTLSEDFIPTYFSGELFNQNSPLILDKNYPCIKVVACKAGHLDSPIKTISVTVSDEESQEELIQRKGAIFGMGAMRPETKIITDEVGFQQIRADLLDDESSSHYTPGSMYQVSLHRRDSNAGVDNDDGL